MTEKVVVIFVEGDTEEEFYKKLLISLKNKNGGKSNCKVIVKNVKGVGNYKAKVSQIFEKKIKKQYPNADIEIILSYDTDIFILAKKPPIDWVAVKRDLIKKGASNVNIVLAKESIEDWFLQDLANILRFLRLPATTKLTGGKGVVKLQNLYKKANKTYIKGKTCKGLIDSLDVDMIFCSICREVHYICQALEIDCNDRRRCL